MLIAGIIIASVGTCGIFTAVGMELMTHEAVWMVMMKIATLVRRAWHGSYRVGEKNKYQAQEQIAKDVEAAKQIPSFQAPGFSVSPPQS